MALQMPVYRELTTIESRVFMGMSWRQLLAAIMLTIVCGGTFMLLWLEFQVSTDLAMYVVIAVFVLVVMLIKVVHPQPPIGMQTMITITRA